VLLLLLLLLLRLMLQAMPFWPASSTPPKMTTASTSQGDNSLNQSDQAESRHEVLTLLTPGSQKSLSLHKKCRLQCYQGAAVNG